MHAPVLQLWLRALIVYPYALPPPFDHDGEMIQLVLLRRLLHRAGDTLVAGMVAALLQQHPPVEALAYGMVRRSNHRRPPFGTSPRGCQPATASHAVACIGNRQLRQLICIAV